MKLLRGDELAEFIKERQARQVRALRQASGIAPKLAIVLTVDNPVIDVYIRLKQTYGADILVDVEVHKVAQKDVPATLEGLNTDENVHGIIVQLPLEDPLETDELTALVAPEKDVDALGPDAMFDPATPMAINWLLAGYNINLPGKDVLLVGYGKLVGAPLEKMMRSSGITPRIATRETEDLAAETRAADVIITATGVPGIITANMIKDQAIVVDAGVASEGGKMFGDLAPDVYARTDLTITPKRGGVGPLTVCALFDNVILSARRMSDTAREQ